MEEKDKLVAQLQEVLKLKKKEIAKIEKPVYKTNMSLNLTGMPVNLNVIGNPVDLTILLAGLISKSTAYTEASKILGVKEPFKHQGFTLGEWTEDILTRVGKINILDKKAELEKIEQRLSKLESKELREQRELEDLKKLLGESE